MFRVEYFNVGVRGVGSVRMSGVPSSYLQHSTDHPVGRKHGYCTQYCHRTFYSATNFYFQCWSDYFRCDTLLSRIHSAWCLQLSKVTHKSASLHTRDNQGYIYGHSFLLPKDIISMLEMGQKLNKILILHAGHTTKEFNAKNDGVHSLDWKEYQGLCSA